jgi:hypothetical protein
MKLKTFALSLLVSTAAIAASAAVYIDVRVGKLELSDTPEIGDVGAVLGEDLPSTAFTLAVGYEITPRAALEARFSDLGDFTVYKVAPSGGLFPTPGPVPLAVTYYFFEQSTTLFSLALPIKLVDRGPFTLSVAPLLHLERSKFVFTNAGVNTLLLPGPLPVLYRDTRTEFHAGGEMKLGYRFTPHIGASLSYSLSALEAYDAHLIGAGFDWRF